MDDRLLEKYGGPVPRYTSYPTAPQFSDAVGPAHYADWLQALAPSDGPVSLYLHVPYCRELCTYCGCTTKITRRYRPVFDYTKDLATEIDLVAAHLAEPMDVSHVHFGGGTPNILAPEDFRSLTGRLRKAFRFREDTEMAVEIDPRTLSVDMAEAMSAAGVTRVSLGVQDLNDRVQQVINRVQPLSVVSRAVSLLRVAGIRHVNLDLMYGLPLQTLEHVLHTVDRAAELGADRVALFGYAHVPWMKKHQRLLDDLPRADARERLEHAEAAARRLLDHGYKRIGFDHFAGPEDTLTRVAGDGTMRRNFQGYTTDTADVLLAFGASAIGQLPGGYVQNAPDTGSYHRLLAAGRLPTVKGVAIDDEDRLRRGVIERLMCDFAVDLDVFGGADAFRPELARLNAMALDGLVRIEGGKIHVEDAARPLVRAVAAVFDTYLTPPEAGAAQRHSIAV